MAPKTLDGITQAINAAVDTDHELDAQEQQALEQDIADSCAQLSPEDRNKVIQLLATKAEIAKNAQKARQGLLALKTAIESAACKPTDKVKEPTDAEKKAAEEKRAADRHIIARRAIAEAVEKSGGKPTIEAAFAGLESTLFRNMVPSGGIAKFRKIIDTGLGLSESLAGVSDSIGVAFLSSFVESGDFDRLLGIGDTANDTLSGGFSLSGASNVSSMSAALGAIEARLEEFVRPIAMRYAQASPQEQAVLASILRSPSAIRSFDFVAAAIPANPVTEMTKEDLTNFIAGFHKKLEKADDTMLRFDSLKGGLHEMLAQGGIGGKLLMMILNVLMDVFGGDFLKDMLGIDLKEEIGLAKKMALRLRSVRSLQMFGFTRAQDANQKELLNAPRSTSIELLKNKDLTGINYQSLEAFFKVFEDYYGDEKEVASVINSTDFWPTVFSGEKRKFTSPKGKVGIFDFSKIDLRGSDWYVSNGTREAVNDRFAENLNLAARAKEFVVPQSEPAKPEPTTPPAGAQSSSGQQTPTSETPPPSGTQPQTTAWASQSASATPVVPAQVPAEDKRPYSERLTEALGKLPLGTLSTVTLPANEVGKTITVSLDTSNKAKTLLKIDGKTYEIWVFAKYTWNVWSDGSRYNILTATIQNSTTGKREVGFDIEGIPSEELPMVSMDALAEQIVSLLASGTYKGTQKTKNEKFTITTKITPVS